LPSAYSLRFPLHNGNQQDIDRAYKEKNIIIIPTNTAVMARHDWFDYSYSPTEHMSLYNDAVCVVVLGAAALKFYLAIEKGN
jgi:hypothetical protein